MKTFKLWHGLLLVAGLFMMVTSCKKDKEEIQLDFNITVPDNWSYIKLNDQNMVYYAQSPQENQQDSILEDLLITRDALSGGTLSTYYTAYVFTLAEDTTYQYVYDADTTINGLESKKLIHLQKLFGIRTQTKDTVVLNTKSLKYFFVHNNYGYVLSFLALEDTYDTFEPVFENIISTFSFKE